MADTPAEAAAEAAEAPGKHRTITQTSRKYNKTGHREGVRFCYGAPDWSDKTLKHSEIKRFSDFQKTEKSRNDALKRWNDSGTMHGFVVRISHD